MIHLLPKNKNAKSFMLAGISILTLSACSLTKTESNNISAAQQSYSYMAQNTEMARLSVFMCNARDKVYT